MTQPDAWSMVLLGLYNWFFHACMTGSYQNIKDNQNDKSNVIIKFYFISRTNNRFSFVSIPQVTFSAPSNQNTSSFFN
jgi:hypothetical protein